jgi:uncharacterized integral membrane protein
MFKTKQFCTKKTKRCISLNEICFCSNLLSIRPHKFLQKMVTAHSPESSSSTSNSDDTNNSSNNRELKSILISLSTILIYYFFSITLTFYNRYLFVTYKYPLSITIIHLFVKYLIASAIRSIMNMLTVKQQTRRITLDWRVYLEKIIPMSVASAVDIGMSNWSLQYITVTLYTMSKSTVILFILFFSILFKLEKWVIRLFLFTFSCY